MYMLPHGGVDFLYQCTLLLESQNDNEIPHVSSLPLQDVNNPKLQSQQMFCWILAICAVKQHGNRSEYKRDGERD
jgi:hypothetical protein